MSSSACLCSARASLLPRSRAATPSISLQIRWISARVFSFFLGDEGFKRKRNQKQRSWLKKPNEITKKSCFQFPTYLPPFPTISPALSGPLCFRDTSQHHAPLPTVASSLLVLPADLQWESAIVSLLPVASAPGRVDSWYSWRSINHGDGMTNDQQPLIGDWDYSRWVLFYSPCISCIDVLGDFRCVMFEYVWHVFTRSWPHLLPMFGNPDFFSISLDLQDMLKIRTAGSKLCSEAQRGILESAALGASED